MNKHSEIRLYNVLFPFWMLLLFPHLWLIVLPGNFFIDSLVLLVSLIVLRVEGKKEWYKKHIIPIYAFGMLADIIGSVYMLFLMIVLEVGRMGDEWYLTIPALVLSAGLIFVFNFFITFRKTEQRLRIRLSLIFAIATAPYTFLVPSSWLY